MPVEIEALPAEPLPPAVEIAVYFVVAEALTNVAKYAHATAATVSVAVAGPRVVVEVADDGDRRRRRRRAARACAGCPTAWRRSTAGSSSTSPPGAGTRLRAEIPL